MSRSKEITKIQKFKKNALLIIYFRSLKKEYIQPPRHQQGCVCLL